MDSEVPAECLDWKGTPWRKGSTEKIAHPNSRFTSPARNNPALSPAVDDPRGVPISAILFGGRRSTTVPLVLEAFNWTHGVYMGATMGSETTAAATGLKEGVRRDPLAMLPFCGYDAGTYLSHWLDMQQRIPNPPKLFMVNWFRKGPDGKFLWPGFGDNMRVLKWILDRCDGRVDARETLIGYTPREEDLVLDGIDTTEEAVRAVTRIDLEEWEEELESQAEWFEKLGPTLPRPLALQRELLLERVRAARKVH